MRYSSLMKLVAGRYQVGMPSRRRPPEHNKSIETAEETEVDREAAAERPAYSS